MEESKMEESKMHVVSGGRGGGKDDHNYHMTIMWTSQDFQLVCSCRLCFLSCIYLDDSVCRQRINAFIPVRNLFAGDILMWASTKTQVTL